MSDDEFSEVIIMAGQESGALLMHLEEYCRTTGVSQMEKLLFRLDAELPSVNDIQILEGLVRGISGVMDVVMENQGYAGVFVEDLHRKFRWLVESCLKQIGESDDKKKLDLALWMAQEGKSLNWLVGEFFRGQLFNHGRIRNQSASTRDLVFTDSELDQIIESLKVRMSDELSKDQIHKMPKIQIYLYGWVDISGSINDVRAWVDEFCGDDEGFLKILNGLRYQVLSDKLYFPLSRESTSTFFDWDEIKSRLDSMREGEHAIKVQELLDAIEMSRH